MDYEPLPLSAHCNAGVELYRPENLSREGTYLQSLPPAPPTGRQIFHGLPFQIGESSGEAPCFIAFGLGGLFREAQSGHGGVVLIEGEAGIGKTRLIDEFTARLRRDEVAVRFLYGSYPPGGAATATNAFAHAFRAHLGETRLAHQLRDYLSDTPSLVPAFAALLPSPGGTPARVLGALAFLAALVPLVEGRFLVRTDHARRAHAIQAATAAREAHVVWMVVAAVLAQLGASFDPGVATSALRGAAVALAMTVLFLRGRAWIRAGQAVPIS